MTLDACTLSLGELRALPQSDYNSMAMTKRVYDRGIRIVRPLK